MHSSFIDYTRHYYEIVAREPLPTMRTGKFVQLWLGDDQEFIIVAPKELAIYHANIVDRFLTERGVAGEYNAKADVYYHRDKAWTILGGGRFELNDKTRTLRLFSQSLAYGPFEQPGLADRLTNCPQLANYRLSLE